jgi:hypothetical protein
MYLTAHSSWQRLPSLLIFFLLTYLPIFARAQGGNEYQFKAALVLKLTRYTTWPSEKLPAGSPLVIGVYGQDSISTQISEAVAGRRINDREVVVKRIATVQEVIGCHVLFVSRSEQDRLGAVLGKTRGNPILTIGETSNFKDKGGIFILTPSGGGVDVGFDLRNLRRSSLSIPPETLVQFNQL